MKQGTKFILEIEIDTDLDSIESIEFVFVQGQKEMKFNYPSDKTMRLDNNIIGLIFDKEDTYYFNVGQILMDSRIKLKDSEYNPLTEIVPFKMQKTLFKEVDYAD